MIDTELNRCVPVEYCFKKNGNFNKKVMVPWDFSVSLPSVIYLRHMPDTVAVCSPLFASFCISFLIDHHKTLKTYSVLPRECP